MKERRYKPEVESLEQRTQPRAEWQSALAPPGIVNDSPAQTRPLQNPPLPAQVLAESHFHSQTDRWDDAEFYPLWKSIAEKNSAQTARPTASPDQGLKYLIHYANKSIRNSKFIHDNDREDLLQEIFMEWRKGVDDFDQALPQLLDADSAERGLLRDSVYRVFGRYRYHQKMNAQRLLGEIDVPAPDSPRVQENRDFTLDLQQWMESLPRLEKQVVQLYYFQNMTMEKIGAEVGLPKQRISEIHRRALERHPDFEFQSEAPVGHSVT